jgi:DNA modification methylase
MKASQVVITGDVRQRLLEVEPKSIRTCITSPPYFGLRDYGHDGQIGLEQTPDEYVEQMVNVFRLVRDTLTDDGTLWLNLGDSYSGSGKGGQSDKMRSEGWQPAYANKGATYGLKPKDLMGIPWRVAFALQADGWYLRQDIIWAKPNPMPEPVKDRCVKSHEYVFLLSKSPRYYYDHEAVRERGVMVSGNSAGSPQRDTRKTHGIGGGNGGMIEAKKKLAQELAEKGYSTRNRRDVWTINTKPFKGAHFAVMPEALVEPCVLAGSGPGDTVLDPFAGSGTVGVVAKRHGREFLGVELNPEYAEMAKTRIDNEPTTLFGTP